MLTSIVEPRLMCPGQSVQLNHETWFRGHDLERSMISAFDGSSIVAHRSFIFQIQQAMGWSLFGCDRFITAGLSQQPPAKCMVLLLQQEIPVPVRVIVQQYAEALRHGDSTNLRLQGVIAVLIPVGHSSGIEFNRFQFQTLTAFVEHCLSRAGTYARDADFPTLQ